VARYFLDRVALAWILVFLPASSLLILHHRVGGPQMGRFHLLGYGLINAFFLFEAWSLTNCGEKSNFYVNHEWRRKIVGMLALPLALVLSNLLFPVLFEGYRKPEGVVVFLFVVLGFIAGAIGFVATREHPIADCGEEDLKQAKRIQKGCTATVVGVVAVLGGTAISSAMRQFYVEIWNDGFLFLCAIFIVAAVAGTFFAYPWLLVRALQKPAAIKKPPPAV